MGSLSCKTQNNIDQINTIILTCNDTLEVSSEKSAKHKNINCLTMQIFLIYLFNEI